MLKNSKVVLFLSKLVRPETFGPYCVRIKWVPCCTRRDSTCNSHIKQIAKVMATRTQTQSQMNTRNLTAELTVTHLGVYYMVYLDWKEANEGFFFSHLQVWNV